jgi:hypothetical protein
MIDEDNIIPITDEPYLDDDIVIRFCEWLKIVYGEDKTLWKKIWISSPNPLKLKAISVEK